MRTEPAAASEVWDAIENPPLAVISDSQWDAIEAAAAAAGAAGRATGRFEDWGQITADRMITLAEMPGAGVLSLINHVAVIRRDDLIEAVVVVDDDRSLLAEILARVGKVDVARAVLARRHDPSAEKPAGRPPGSQKAETEPPAPPAPQAAVDLAMARWEACQVDPHGTLQSVAAVRRQGGSRQEIDRKVGRLLGVCSLNGRPPATAALRAAIEERLGELEDLASAPEAMPEPEPAVEATPEAAPASLVAVVATLTHDALVADAWRGEPALPTTLQAIDGWRDRCRFWQGDWRECFPRLTDHLGPNAAAAISHATGATHADVVAHGDAIRARHQQQLATLRDAYHQAAELTADAADVGGWAWLASHLEVTVEAVLELCRELTTDPRQAAGAVALS